MVEAFGTAASAAMVVCYALEERSAAYTWGFAAGCLAAAAYAAAIGAWPFFALESIWSVLAVRRASRASRARPRVARSAVARSNGEGTCE